MKKLFIGLALAIMGTVNAQDAADTTSNWKKGGVVSLSFSQVALENWAAGGENSISGTTLLSVFSNYKNEKVSWDNTLDLGYGLLKQGDEGVIKSDDKIDLSSKFGYAAKEKLSYSMMMNFKSQFAPGYATPAQENRISDWMAPGYFLLAAGVDYKPSDKVSLFVSPLTGKITVVMADRLANEGAFGVEPAVFDTNGVMITAGKKVRAELGGFLKIEAKHELMENVTIQTNMGFFSNYIENPQNIDVNMEALLSMKVNKYITASLNMILLYDHDILVPVDRDEDGVFESTGRRTQFKEVFGLGFSYKF